MSLNPAIRALQAQLAALGFDPGPSDGIAGLRTKDALQTFFDRAKLAFHVDITAEGNIALTGPMITGVPANMTATPSAVDKLPWMAIARDKLGLHETRDNAVLRRFLSSDGHNLGNPEKLPWCGDFAETCMKLALPSEHFTGKLAQNPYYARNWLAFGTPCLAVYGSIVVFERGPHSGHVGFAVGQDGEAIYTLGGNQSDGVTIARIAKSRVLGHRWPLTFPNPSRPLINMQPGAVKLSTNEA
jgi:uncharacterized protein (TIGR02594 family)